MNTVEKIKEYLEHKAECDKSIYSSNCQCSCGLENLIAELEAEQKCDTCAKAYCCKGLTRCDGYVASYQTEIGVIDQLNHALQVCKDRGETIDKLLKENAELKAEIAKLKETF